MNRLIATLSIALTLVAWPAFSQTPRTTLAGHSESSGAAAPEATTSQHAVRVRVSPHNSFAPGYVEAVIQIEPDTRNRRLRVEVDSGAYYRGTNVQLDGDTAARSHFFRMNGLPPGEYTVVVNVLRENHTRIETRARFVVLGT